MKHVLITGVSHGLGRAMTMGFKAANWTVSGCGTDAAALQSLTQALGPDHLIQVCDVSHNHPEWQWAELDRKRLVWVTKGVLYAATIHGKRLGDLKVLHDFNDMAFEAIAAPY